MIRFVAYGLVAVLLFIPERLLLPQPAARAGEGKDATLVAPEITITVTCSADRKWAVKPDWPMLVPGDRVTLTAQDPSKPRNYREYDVSWKWDTEESGGFLGLGTDTIHHDQKYSNQRVEGVLGSQVHFTITYGERAQWRPTPANRTFSFVATTGGRLNPVQGTVSKSPINPERPPDVPANGKGLTKEVTAVREKELGYILKVSIRRAGE